MKRTRCVGFVGALTLLLGGAAVATAADQQAVGQQATSSQSAESAATSTQVAPTNENIDVRIHSPGDNGAVTQTNSSAAASAAANANTTNQAAAQQQAGGGGTQAAGQAASNAQAAQSNATSTQVKPKNTNISVRIDSPGDGGSVDQTNSSAAKSAAVNANDTTQSAEQAQAGGSCCSGTSGGTQTAGQAADNDQTARSSATATQKHPTNTNIAVRIHSPGKDGDVTQTNSSEAASLAANANATDWSVAQQQGGGSCCAGSTTQAAGQSAGSEQSAASTATSTQVKPTNTNTPVRIGSPGDSGSVTQTNASHAASAALNANDTDQSAAQQQAGDGGTGVQAVGQSAANAQQAASAATSHQTGASNTNAPVRIGSSGNDGSVTQTNASVAKSIAANHNDTDQTAIQQQAGGCCTSSHGGTYDPPKDGSYDSPKNGSSDSPKDGPYDKRGDCCHGGTGVQAIGQKVANEQSAQSTAESNQSGASNTNAPVRIGSSGGSGSVEQNNASLAASAALNANATTQGATQQQAGGLGTAVQAIGQKAVSAQSAVSSATSTQYKPSNSNTPVRIGSSGDDGSVTQTNASLAKSIAANLNATDQTATQQQAGSCCRKSGSYSPKDCGCSHGTLVQAIGQAAANRQAAWSAADSTQKHPTNTNAPVREWSSGGGGSLTQTNLSWAGSIAANANALTQYATQQQGGGA
jgi:hypothetical protein